MHRRWLSLPLLSSCVSAFYPYSEGQSIEEKRFVPYQKPQSVDDSVIKVDIHRVEKRTNNFPVILSNTPSAPNAMAIDQDGNDYSYFSVVKFGSNAQPMYMLIDTGSANTWVFSSSCTSASCNIHNTFGPANSTTLNTTTSTWSLAYGSGQVSGNVGTDTVAFANYTLDMSFGLATTASNDFNNYPMDGILGLGRPKSNTLGVPTVMQALDTQQNLVNNIVGIHLNRAADNTKDGEITFGGIDTSKFSGTIGYTAVADDESWQIPIQDAVVNNKACGFTGKSAVIDTGTTYILMPTSDAVTLHANIPGSQQNGESFTVPCNTNTPVQINISGVLYSISPKDYVGKASGGICSSNIIGHQAFGPNQWILGDVFLKNVYSVFDFDGARIGFAPTGTGGSTGSSSSSSSSTTMAPATSSTSSSTQSATTPGMTGGSAGTPFGTDSDAHSGSVKTLPRIVFALSVAFFIGFIL